MKTTLWSFCRALILIAAFFQVDRGRAETFTNSLPHPVVTIVSPTNSQVFFAPADIPISVLASSSNAIVVNVEVFSGTNSLGIATNNPASAGPANLFHFTWTNAPAGEFSLTAKATDSAGSSGISDPVRIVIRAPAVLPVVTLWATVTNAAETPPFSEIPTRPGIFTVRRNPASAQELVVKYGIEGTASNGVDYQALSGSVTIPANESSATIVVLPIDDTLVEGTETVVLNLKTNAAYIVGDPHHAVVFIEDNDVNPLPAIRITTPASNAVFFAPAMILIRAEAPSVSSQIARVDFFAGDTLLGFATNAPFELLWTNVPAGSYKLGAKATDIRGATAFAPGIPITVRSPNEVAFVKRALPMWYVPGAAFTVQLRAEPPPGTTSYSIVDVPPTNWLAASRESDTFAAQVNFGPFNDGLARTLSYVVVPTNSNPGEQFFSGVATANGLTTPVGGMNSIVPAPPHPADNNPANFFLSDGELADYVAAWRRCERWAISPNLIPVSYVTRAGYLRAKGGNYTLSTNVPTPLPPLIWVSQPMNLPPGNAILWNTNDSGNAVRSMPTNCFPGVPFTVSIAMTPLSNTLACAIEERPPEGWAVTNISDGGVFCPITRKIRWGLFNDNSARTLTYEVTPRAISATALAEFAGVASFDGVDAPIGGQRTIRFGGIVTSGTARLQSVAILDNGDRLMTFLGEPGTVYRIEASNNFLDWTPLQILVNEDGVLQYVDVAGEKLEKRFYCVVPVN